jgi:hypothetical protein
MAINILENLGAGASRATIAEFIAEFRLLGTIHKNPIESHGTSAIAISAIRTAPR